MLHKTRQACPQNACSGNKKKQREGGWRAMKKFIIGLCICALIGTVAPSASGVDFATKAMTSMILLIDSGNSITLNLGSKNIPDSITVVTDSVDVSIFKSFSLYLNCATNHDSGMAATYYTSPDPSVTSGVVTNWYEGLVSISALDTNKQVVVIDEANSGEAAIKWFKLHIDRTTCAGNDSATVGAWLIGKTR